MRADLVSIITAERPEERDRALEAATRDLGVEALRSGCRALDDFRRHSASLYERVRALVFLWALHRFRLPTAPGYPTRGALPVDGVLLTLDRRFEEAIDLLQAAEERQGPSAPLSSALAAAYQGLAFQTLADQVRRSVRTTPGNAWLFETATAAGHPLALHRALRSGERLLVERTPVRMDLSHSAWSDIFFLGMDHPEGARVLNVSIDLAVRGRDPQPRPPIETWVRALDRPVLRLVSADLDTAVETTSLAEVFDFARDMLGLLKGSVIASGLVPAGLEGSGERLVDVLARVAGPGRGIEIGSHVRGIPKGSRLAVSTNLLASLIAVQMRATGQTGALEGPLSEDERRLAAARAILGEWLAGSGGGWQDSGGLWPGAKLIEGVVARPGDPEHGTSRGCLLPRHTALGPEQLSARTLAKLRASLVLVHGGLAQDVGPVLERVTEAYLLRREPEWSARRRAQDLMDDVLGALREGDIRALAAATTRNFEDPIRTIVPWASDAFTERLRADTRAAFGDDAWGFWMLGGMAGGGMGFWFAPERRDEGADFLRTAMARAQAELGGGVPFAIEPVVYDFAPNDHGSVAALAAPDALAPVDPLPGRAPEEAADGGSLATLLAAEGFDPALHESVRRDLASGRIGLARNRLPPATRLRPAGPDDVLHGEAPGREAREARGRAALERGEVAVLTLAGGAGSRWTQGAGVVKALHPFARLGGRHRCFLEVHLAKSRRSTRRFGAAVPHVVTTSYATHDAIAAWLGREGARAYEGPLHLSRGRAVGRRLVPPERELRFAFEGARQRLDEPAQKLRDSTEAAWIAWAREAGAARDYVDEVPRRCLHPVGHWYEVPNLLVNGTLRALLRERPGLTHLMLHNVDTLGADLDPALLGLHLEAGAALSYEVVPRHVHDRGGGLARVDGRLRLVEGLALPDERDEWRLPYYGSMTTWIALDPLLATFGLSRDDLDDPAAVRDAVRRLAARLPTYVVLKEVKRRLALGHEEILPTCQWEKLWGDMTALDGVDCAFLEVPRRRGQQLKEPAELDGWLRDGTAAHVESLCDWA